MKKFVLVALVVLCSVSFGEDSQCVKECKERYTPGCKTYKSDTKCPINLVALHECTRNCENMRK